VGGKRVKLEYDLIQLMQSR